MKTLIESHLRIDAKNICLQWRICTDLQIYYWGKSRLSARRRREIPGYPSFVNVRGGGTDRHKITKLTPYTNYIFVITAYNSGGEGPASNEAFAPTEEDSKFFKGVHSYLYLNKEISK